MARANRHFIPGYVWHLTHRCHKRRDFRTKSIATGSRSFVEEVKMKMGGFAVGRHVQKDSGNDELRETQSAYDILYENEKIDRDSGNLWDRKINGDISDG